MNHPYVKRCTACQLKGLVCFIGDFQYRCQVCGGVEFSVLRRKWAIRRLIDWFREEHLHG